MNKYNIPDVKTFEFTKIIGLEHIKFGKNIIIDDFVLIYVKRMLIKLCSHCIFLFR
jgi:galactoside O-acetyltransferase